MILTQFVLNPIEWYPFIYLTSVYHDAQAKDVPDLIGRLLQFKMILIILMASDLGHTAHHMRRPIEGLQNHAWIVIVPVV